MLVKLIKPHEKQKLILDALLDPNIFYTVAVIGRQFGKTMLAQNIATYWALNDPGCEIFFVSPTDNQNLRIYRSIVNAVIGSGCIESRKMPRGGTEIIFTNGSKILFRSAASEDSLRGPAVEYMILDEAAFMKKETVDTILLPMLSVKGKKIYVSSTPKGKNWLYDWYLKGQEGNNSYKSFRFSTYDSPYSNVELVNMFKETMSEKLFKQEIEAEFIDSASVFNNVSDLMILDKQLTPKEGETYYAGIDIGLVNDASVLSILDSNGDMVAYYRWLNIESPELIKEIVNINRIWNFKLMLIENNNQGLTIYQELKRQIKNIEDFNTNQKTKPEIINNLIHSFNMREIKLLKDDYLRIELEAFIFKQKDGKIKFMSDSGFHDDCVMALAIARECFLLCKKKMFNPKAASIFVPRPRREIDEEW